MRRWAMGLMVVAMATGSAFGTMISDDFSDNNYTANPTWTVVSGQFAADGTNVDNYLPTAGMLNFGTVGNNSISLSLPNIASTSPVTISFDLYQSNEAYGGSYDFGIALKDTLAGKQYTVDGMLTPNWFGNYYTGQLSGFGYYISDAIFSGGLGGTSLKNYWQQVVFTFDPVTGGTFSYGETTVATWTNFRSLNRIDTIQLTSGGTVSWFVDNVQVTYVPEPATLMGLGLGGVAGILRRRHKAL
jgi:hypothetical protein